MKKTIFITTILLFALFITGCSSASSLEDVKETRLKDEYGQDEIITVNFSAEDKQLIDWTQFVSSDHELGRDSVTPENVEEDEQGLMLLSPENCFSGSQKRSLDRMGYGTYIANIKTDHAAGSYTAFFMYEGVAEKNDEIDIEIYNDGSRKIDFVIWKDGERTNYEQKLLNFDPTSDFYEYRFDYYPEYIAFFVDGELMAYFTENIPQSDMYLLANHWWPTWMEADSIHNESRNYIQKIEKVAL
ncbi:MAG: family 16 glycosylhydrolase [Bacillota bacterium]